jgi:hypothetical protein
MQIQIRPPIMTITEQRDSFPELLAKVDDEFLSTVYAMLETYVRKQQEPVVGYTVSGEAVTVSQFITEADAAVAAAKAGEGISVDELRKRSEGWLARSK